MKRAVTASQAAKYFVGGEGNREAARALFSYVFFYFVDEISGTLAKWARAPG